MFVSNRPNASMTGIGDVPTYLYTSLNLGIRSNYILSVNLFHSQIHIINLTYVNCQSVLTVLLLAFAPTANRLTQSRGRPTCTIVHVAYLPADDAI